MSDNNMILSAVLHLKVSILAVSVHIKCLVLNVYTNTILLYIHPVLSGQWITVSLMVVMHCSKHRRWVCVLCTLWHQQNNTLLHAITVP